MAQVGEKSFSDIWVSHSYLQDEFQTSSAETGVRGVGEGKTSQLHSALV